MNIKKYKLQRYTGINSRHTCPNCGHPREFALYVDENGNPIDESCGRCNREKCGYHLPPSEFFKEHPDLKKSDITKWVQPKQPEVKAVNYLPSSVIVEKDVFRAKNNLFRFMANEFGNEESNRVFELYKVRTSRHWRNHDGLSTIFPQIDGHGRVRQVKVMAYNPSNGKRMKKSDYCELWIDNRKEYVADNRGIDKIWFAGKTLLKNQEANLQQTFFGCHLLKDASNVGIVESEKTALLCAILMPSITWISTGGCNGCRWIEPHQTDVLKGKRVVLYPDAGMYQKWLEKSKHLSNAGVEISVSPICCNQPDNTDIADMLLLERQRNKAKPTTISDVCRWMEELGIEKSRITFNV